MLQADMGPASLRRRHDVATEYIMVLYQRAFFGPDLDRATAGLIALRLFEYTV